MVLRRI